MTDVAPVMDAAARFLGVRPRSIAEVRARLLRTGYPAPLVEVAIVRLGELGYLDDRAFGRAWLESRDRAHPRGEAALRRELHQKGLDREVIRELLEERTGGTAGRGGSREAGTSAGGPQSLEPSSPDLSAAQRVLAARSGALRRELDPRRRRAKAWALLARHGFDPDTCREVLDAWSAGERDSADQDGGTV